MIGHESSQLEGCTWGTCWTLFNYSSRHRTSSPNKYLYQNINSVEVGKPDSERGISSWGRKENVSANLGSYKQKRSQRGSKSRGHPCPSFSRDHFFLQTSAFPCGCCPLPGIFVASAFWLQNHRIRSIQRIKLQPGLWLQKQTLVLPVFLFIQMELCSTYASVSGFFPLPSCWWDPTSLMWIVIDHSLPQLHGIPLCLSTPLSMSFGGVSSTRLLSEAPLGIFTTTKSLLGMCVHIYV